MATIYKNVYKYYFIFIFFRKITHENKDYLKIMK